MEGFNQYFTNEDNINQFVYTKIRFVFIDLTAGPFEWGPSLSGEGVRTRFTLPSIPKKNQLIEEKNKPSIYI